MGAPAHGPRLAATIREGPMPRAQRCPCHAPSRPPLPAAPCTVSDDHEPKSQPNQTRTVRAISAESPENEPSHGSVESGPGTPTVSPSGETQPCTREGIARFALGKTGKRVANLSAKPPSDTGRPVTPNPLKSRWSGRQDLNLRPSAPKADALPGCATPRYIGARGCKALPAPGKRPLPSCVSGRSGA